MEMRLVNGDYVVNVWGGFETVSGHQELVQRILFKLTARRGGFALMPELGSRLYLLSQEKPSNRISAAQMYIREALGDEAGLELTSLEIKENDGVFELLMEFEYENSGFSLTAYI